MYIDRWDKYEKEKEDLTTANIIQDLKEYYRRYVQDMIFLIIFILPLFYGFFWLLLYLYIDMLMGYELGKTFNITFFCIFLIITLAAVAMDTSKIIDGFSAIKNRSFDISTDIVIKKLPKHYGSKYRSNRPYTLEFKHSDPYKIPEAVNYKWSLFYPSTDKDIYECASLNDEFYLISVGKQKSIIGYNKKHFELKE